MKIDSRQVRATLSIMRDGRYHFALVNDDGERVDVSRISGVRVVDRHRRTHRRAPFGQNGAVPGVGRLDPCDGRITGAGKPGETVFTDSA